MEALDVETSRAEGEQSLQALITFVRDNAGKLAAHEAEQGIFKRLLPMGLAAMKRSCAQRGPGDGGPAVTRADGVLLPREQQLRGRDSWSIFGQFKVLRTCYRAPGAPGIFPLDAQGNLPERCALACNSSISESGFESATIAPPTPKLTSPGFTIKVRIAIARSTS